MNPEKIILFKGPGTSADDVEAWIKASFRRDELIILKDVDALHREAQRIAEERDPPLFFVLPGIAGEDSPYNRYLDKRAMKALAAITRYSTLLAICGGAYFIGHERRFLKSDGTPLRKTNDTPLIPIDCTGPLPPEDARFPARDTADSLSAVRVSAIDRTGQRHEGWIAYALGPVIHARAAFTTAVKPLAHYAGPDSRPMACAKYISSLDHRQVIALGVLPYIRGDALAAFNPELVDVLNAPASRHVQDALLGRIANNIRTHYRDRQTVLARERESAYSPA